MMLLLAAFVGANTVVTRYLNACYGSNNTLLMGNLTNYVTGLATSLLAMLVMGDPFQLQPIGSLTFRTVSMFLGGAVGVGLIQLFIYTTPRMPAFLATLLVFLGQLGVGLILDYLLTGDFSLGKLLGGVMVLLGLWHYAWVSKPKQAKNLPTASAT